MLLRFAVTDYYSENTNRVYGEDEELSEGAIISQQTMFGDFDIIELTFSDAYFNKVTIPVVSTSTDIVGPTEEPEEFPHIELPEIELPELPTLNELEESGILRVIALILGIIVLIFVMQFIVKFINFLIRCFGKLIESLTIKKPPKKKGK